MIVKPDPAPPRRTRACFTSDGSSKYAWSSRAAARAALRRMSKADGLKPYRCPECRRYHVGHPRQETER